MVLNTVRHIIKYQLSTTQFKFDSKASSHLNKGIVLLVQKHVSSTLHVSLFMTDK